MRRYVFVGFAVASAMITPPDIVSMVGLWIPLIVLYELGIWAVAVIVHPYLEKQHMGSDVDQSNDNEKSNDHEERDS